MENSDNNINTEQEQQSNQIEQSFASIIGNISNHIFLSDENIQMIFNLMFFNPISKDIFSSEILNSISLKDDTEKVITQKFELIMSQLFERVKQAIEQNNFSNEIYRERAAMLQQIGWIEHQKEIDRIWNELEISKIDRIVKILKSKHKRMYIDRIFSFQYQQPANQKILNLNLSLSDLKDLDFTYLPKLIFIKENQILNYFNDIQECIQFFLNGRYKISIRSSDYQQQSKESNNLFDKISREIFQQNIFPCFTAIELFKLRAVSQEWKEYIRICWYQTFKVLIHYYIILLYASQREMIQQLRAADICSEIENQFKIINMRTPFFQKSGIFLKAIFELIDWNELNMLLNEETSHENEQSNHDIQEKQQLMRKIIYCIFLLLGHKNSKIKNLNDFNDETWQEIQQLAQINLIKSKMDNALEFNFKYMSNEEIIILKEQFIFRNELAIDNLRLFNEKNLIVMCLFTKLLCLFMMLKNSILVLQKYLNFAKEKLKLISQQWPQKKGFLEGAYRILLFKSSLPLNKIQNASSTQDEEDQSKLKNQLQMAIDSHIINKETMNQTESQSEHQQIINQQQSHQTQNNYQSQELHSNINNEIEFQKKDLISQKLNLQQLKDQINSLRIQTENFQTQYQQRRNQEKKCMEDFQQKHNEYFNQILLIKLFPVYLLKLNKKNQNEPDIVLELGEFQTDSIINLFNLIYQQLIVYFDQMTLNEILQGINVKSICKNID